MNRYDPKTDMFTRYTPNPEDQNSISDMKIMCERSDAIGAKFNLYSEPGEGSQLTVTWQDKETK